MKKICLTTVIFMFLLFLFNGIQAQTTQTTLNQIDLLQKFLGTWQADVGKDTIEVWEGQQYGKAVIITVSQIIKGKKTPLYINNMGFDSRDGKLKGFLLYPNTDFFTWIGLFTADKQFSADIVDTFSPEKVGAKYNMEFKSPTNRIMSGFSTDGVKFLEYNFNKVK